MRTERVMSFLPLVAMVAVQLGLAGVNIISKVAIDTGMSPFVLVVYRQVVAGIVTTPYAIFLERDKPPLNKEIMMQIFQCSFFGATGNQLLYFVGLKFSSVTISCALGNILPAFTFIIAVVFKMEALGLKSMKGQVKVAGTLVCIGGSMLLSLYHGPEVPIGQSKIHWNAVGGAITSSSHHEFGSFFGPFLVLLSYAFWAIWLIIQTKLSESFDAPYIITSVTSFMSAIQCIILAAIVNHHPNEWYLFDQPLRFVASFYSGMVGSTLAFCVTTWTIKKKGPIYVTMFSPLLMVLVAFLSWALLREKVYTGTVLGSFLIVLGLYAIIWGNNKEERDENEAPNHREITFEDVIIERVNELIRRGGKEPMTEDNDDIHIVSELQPSTSQNHLSSEINRHVNDFKR